MKIKSRTITGIAVAPGIALGTAYIIGAGGFNVPEYQITTSKIEDEVSRFQSAVKAAQKQLRQLQSRAASLPKDAASEISILLDAHFSMLEDSRLVRGVIAQIQTHKLNAEAAIDKQINEIAESFSKIDDAYIAARVEDVREVGMRLLRLLLQQNHNPFINAPRGAILIAEEITPADTALMNPEQISGFATVLGGPEGHAAIMARALGIPAVLGVTELLSGIKPHDPIIIDGNKGEIIIHPTSAQIAEANSALAREKAESGKLRSLRKLPAKTRDGITVHLMANMELPHEAHNVLDTGAVGVGLLRTEFMYMNRPTLPDEDEQFEALKTIITALDGRPLTIRTLDIGGDKIASALGNHLHSTNPALGLRAIRLGLKMPRILEAQIAAILRASAYGDVRILIPLVSSAEQMRSVRKIVADTAKRLRRRGVKIGNPLPPIGAMIEIPGAALGADSLAQVSDFFSIGSNDLTQYTLAIDRADEQVAELYNPLHPAVLRLIQFSTMAALRARIPVTLCGEMAGDPAYTSLLVGLGLRELSMSPKRLPRVKYVVRQLDIAESAMLADRIMSENDDKRIAQILADEASKFMLH